MDRIDASPPESLREVVHGDEVAALVRQELVVRGAGPPIAVERSAPPDGGRALVVLVHGLAQNRFTWRIEGRSLCAWLVQRGFEVWNVELRGHGRSRALGAPSATAFDDYVDDLARVVSQAGQAPFVVGHSLGAAVALSVAPEYTLRGLVHLAGVYRFAEHNWALRALARLTLGFESHLRSAPPRVRTALLGRILGRLYALSDVAGYGAPISGWAPGSIERPLLEDRLARGFDWTSAEIWIQMSRWALGEPAPFVDSFPSLSMPLLVVAGDADPLVKPDDARAAFAASQSPDKELVVFDAYEHRVHWGHIDLILGQHAPEIVWPRLGDWLVARC